MLGGLSMFAIFIKGGDLIREKIAFLNQRGFGVIWDTHMWRPPDKSAEILITVTW